MGKQSRITVQSKDTACTTKLEPPPWSAFVRLLVDPDDDHNLKRLLAKYRDPERQHRLLQHLKAIAYTHRLSKSTARTVSRERAWFKKRDRWRMRVFKLDTDLAALLVSFEETIYPALRASDSLPEGYFREIKRVAEAIDLLKQSTASSSILSNKKFTTRGHQRQPYIKQGVTALSRLNITGADANELLTLIGVKPDPA